MVELSQLSSLSDFANVISYPSKDRFEEILKSVESLEEDYPELSEGLVPFKKYLHDHSKDTIEELYTKTFEVQGICCLDLGYVLFGEEYKRGAFLVNISRMLNEFGVDPGSELADHLPNVLMLLSKMPDNDERFEFIQKIMIPALEKMLENFPEREDKTNVYRYPLLMTKMYLENMVAKRHIQ